MIVEVIGEVVMPKLLAVVINNANAGTLTNGISIRTMFLMILTAIVMMAGRSFFRMMREESSMSEANVPMSFRERIRRGLL